MDPPAVDPSAANLNRRPPPGLSHWVVRAIAFTIIYVFLTLFKLEPIARNSVQDVLLPPPPHLISSNVHGGMQVNTTLIIATVPRDEDHARALWSHLECLTERIDRVLVAAPDVDWSRNIVEAIVQDFMLAAAINQRSVPIIETVYFDNNRYDVGLWCDALATVPKNQATFLVNDSAFSRINFNNLTERIVRATKQEHIGQLTNVSSSTMSLKLLSLNGRLGPSEPPGTKYNWVESVYRGFTPQGLITFISHSCNPEATKKCLGKGVRCIVDNFEIALSGAYPKGEVGAIYPSFVPSSDEEMKDWKMKGINMTELSEQKWVFDQWRDGKAYYHYLVDKFNFPLLKVKAKQKFIRLNPGIECYRTANESFFASLFYPSKMLLNAYHESIVQKGKIADP